MSRNVKVKWLRIKDQACEEWKDYDKFLEWYEPRANAIRGDTVAVNTRLLADDKPYGPDNCCVITMKVQGGLTNKGDSNNTKKNRVLANAMSDGLPEFVLDIIRNHDFGPEAVHRTRKKSRKIYGGKAVSDISVPTSKRAHPPKSYTSWLSIINTCNRDSTWSLCDEWLTYSRFHAWFEENYIPGFRLTRSVIGDGRTVYGPDTCCYLPLWVARLMVPGGPESIRLPGVKAKRRKFHASITINKKATYIGSFDSEEEAYKAYAIRKTAVIREEADRLYKEGLIKKHIHDAMVNYTMPASDQYT